MKITERCQTVKGLIKFAKAIKQSVHQSGETFWWAPIGCENSQIAELAEIGYHLIEIDGRFGLGWSKRKG